MASANTKLEIPAKYFKYKKIPVKLPRLKETVAPAGKLYNWNTICDIYKTIDVSITADMKSLIIAGDLDMLNEVLRQVYRNCGEYKLVSRDATNVHLTK